MTVIMLDRLYDIYYVRHTLWHLLCSPDFVTVIMLDTLYDRYYVRQTLWQLLC